MSAGGNSCCIGGFLWGLSMTTSSRSLSTIVFKKSLALWHPIPSDEAAISLSSMWDWVKCNLKLAQVLSTAGFLIHL